jgi:hypothetical protein
MTDWMAWPKSIGTSSHAILKVGVGSPKLDHCLTLLFQAILVFGQRLVKKEEEVIEVESLKG